MEYVEGSAAAGEAASFENQYDDAVLRLPARPGAGPRPAGLTLRLEVIDAEVVAALEELDGPARDAFALKALRLGVLAIRSAGGQLDAEKIQKEGERMLAQVGQLLAERGASLTAQLSTELTRYLDPKTGTLPQKLSALTSSGGELERLLKAHLGADDSTLARSLTASLGATSPIFKMLSPTDATGLKVQLEQGVKVALEEQRKAVVKEFSLDDEGSALSRLVKRVEDAQKQITKEFTLDNEQSALTRMSRLLKETSQQIDKNLTLDDEGSALFRLKRELTQSLAELGKRNDAFQQEVKTTLEVLNARKAEAAKGTQHGLDFEAQLSQLLLGEAQKLGDEHEAVGNSPGVLKPRKYGDVVTRLGLESAAPGVGVVWEAKQKQGFTLAAARSEVDFARQNRSCQLGVFVFSREYAPEGLAPLARYGNDLVVVWDANDPTSDVYVRAAYSIARALAVRQMQSESTQAEALTAIEKSAAALGKHLAHCADLKKKGETSRSAAEAIVELAMKLQAGIESQVVVINESLAALKKAD